MLRSPSEGLAGHGTTESSVCPYEEHPYVCSKRRVGCWLLVEAMGINAGLSLCPVSGAASHHEIFRGHCKRLLDPTACRIAFFLDKSLASTSG